MANYATVPFGNTRGTNTGEEQFIIALSTGGTMMECSRIERVHLFMQNQQSTLTYFPFVFCQRERPAADAHLPDCLLPSGWPGDSLRFYPHIGREVGRQSLRKSQSVKYRIER